MMNTMYTIFDDEYTILSHEYVSCDLTLKPNNMLVFSITNVGHEYQTTSNIIILCANYTSLSDGPFYSDIC